MAGLSYAGYRWVPLSRSDLSKVTRSLDEEHLRQWLVAESAASFYEAITNRLSAELNGKSLTLIIRDGRRIVGLTSLSDYHGMYGVLQASTYLHPDYWGRGLNGLCKSMLWEIAHDVLQHPSIVASVHQDNQRSQSAMRKHFPQSKESEVYEFWRPRYAHLFEILGPPLHYTPLSNPEKKSLHRMLARTPAWQRWSLHVPGTLPKIGTRAIVDSVGINAASSEALLDATPQIEAVMHVVDEQSPSLQDIDEASELLAQAQHQANVAIVQLVQDAESLSENAQSLAVEAIVELHEEKGESLDAATVKEITQAMAEQDPDPEPWIELSEN